MKRYVGIKRVNRVGESAQEPAVTPQHSAKEPTSRLREDLEAKAQPTDTPLRPALPRNFTHSP